MVLANVAVGEWSNLDPSGTPFCLRSSCCKHELLLASGIEINVAYSIGEPLPTGLLGKVVQVVHCTIMPGSEEGLGSAFQAEHAGADCVCLEKGAPFSLHKEVILSPGSVHPEGTSVSKLQRGTLFVSSSPVDPWNSGKPAAPPRTHSGGTLGVASVGCATLAPES